MGLGSGQNNFQSLRGLRALFVKCDHLKLILADDTVEIEVFNRGIIHCSDRTTNGSAVSPSLMQAGWANYEKTDGENGATVRSAVRMS